MYWNKGICICKLWRKKNMKNIPWKFNGRSCINLLFCFQMTIVGKIFIFATFLTHVVCIIYEINTPESLKYCFDQKRLKSNFSDPHLDNAHAYCIQKNNWNLLRTAWPNISEETGNWVDELLRMSEYWNDRLDDGNDKHNPCEEERNIDYCPTESVRTFTRLLFDLNKIEWVPFGINHYQSVIYKIVYVVFVSYKNWGIFRL